jgi:hypothetical protein
MRSTGYGVLLACAIAEIACSGAGGTSSCEINIQTEPPQELPFETDICLEWTGASDRVTARQQDCASSAQTTDGGVILRSMFVNGPCPRANIGGGCRNTLDGITSITWYYSVEAYLAGGVMNICAGEGTTYVPPP